MKVRDKDVKRTLMDAIVEFKQQVAAVFNVMSQDSQEHIDNLLIAQLNDAAYKAIRKTGLRKKLDERTIKNEEFFKKLDLQLNAAHKKIDFDKVAAAQEAIMDEKVGVCPMSQCNVLDLMRAKDAMCIGLSVKRSEATIADPTKLVIAKVFPVYMSLDSFLESAIFNLKMNQDAAGNFDITDEAGKLAVGAGREELTGLLPLFLFPEHWELAKRKAQSLYGFMCTLEPLGYTQSQFFTIPFLVLSKALQQSLAEPSEAMDQVVQLVLETCAQMIGSNNTFKQQTIEALLGFLNNPAGRTADVVADVGVLAAQMYAWSQLPEDQRYPAIEDPQAAGESNTVPADQLGKFARFAVEEMLRRQQKIKDAPGKAQLLKLLVPGYEQLVEEVKSMTHRVTQEKMSRGQKVGGAGAYASYQAAANALRERAQAAAGGAGGAQAAAE